MFSKKKLIESILECLKMLFLFFYYITVLSFLAVTNASTAVTGSKRLKQLLRMILALGNFLNRGKRNGNAYG